MLPDARTRDLVLPGIISVVAENDPREAAGLVSQLPAGEAQATATSAVVWQWAANDAAGASKWVASFPEGQARERAVDDPANLSPLWLKTKEMARKRAKNIYKFFNIFFSRSF